MATRGRGDEHKNAIKSINIKHRRALRERLRETQRENMTEVTRVHHGSQSLSALLTGQVQFVKGTSADGETSFYNSKKQGEEEQRGSPMKRSRTASQEQLDAVNNEKGAAASAGAAADAVADEDDHNTAAWFKTMIQKQKNGDKGEDDEDGADDDDADDATKDNKKRSGGVGRRSSLAAKSRFPHPASISPTPEGSEFTTNWFTHNQPALLRVFESLGWAGQASTAGGGRHRQPKHILEVGCWEGRGSQWLLTTLCRRQGAVHSPYHTPTHIVYTPDLRRFPAKMYTRVSF